MPAPDANEDDAEQSRQTQEAGCCGLTGGWAFSVTTKEDVNAEEASHDDAPFICRECLSDAVLRKCVEKIDHFAHHARTSPALHAGESELHQACLGEICDALAQRFPDGKWQTNREIPANEELGVDKVVPDISGNCNGQRLVIEAQVSQLSLKQIIKRSEIYTRRNIPILWIVPLRADLGEEPFRPRLYERYLHTMAFGRTYYWKPGFGASVLPVHYGLAYRHIPFSEWFYVDAKEHRDGGGYDKPYKVIKSPLSTDRADIINDFRKCQRLEFRPWNERKRVPPLLTWQDTRQEWWDKSENEDFCKEFPENNKREG